MTTHPIPNPAPLSPEHLRELSDARKRCTKIRRAAAVAAVSGWTMALFAAVTILSGLLGDLPAVLLGFGLAAVAFNEIRGGAMLRRLDLRGPRRLALNQIALGTLLVVYALWNLFAANNSVLASMGGSTGDPQMDATIGSLSNMITYGLYGGLAAIGVIAPGLTSWYYFSRAGHIRRVQEQTPAWVIEAMQAAV